PPAPRAAASPPPPPAPPACRSNACSSFWRMSGTWSLSRPGSGEGPSPGHSPERAAGDEVRQAVLGAGAVTALQGAEPRDEQVQRRVSRAHACEVDTPPQAGTVPALGVHDVVGAHLRQYGPTAARLVHVLVHEVEVSQRVPVPAL